MVKRTRITALAIAVGLVPAALWPLGSPQPVVVRSETLELPGAPAASAASLLRLGDRLVAVYADLSTLSLEVFEVPADGPLPPKAPPASFADRIDIASPLLATFGAHAAAASASGALELLYVDRERDDRLLLKRVTRAASGADWMLDLLEPCGLPIALAPLPRSGFAAFWTAGGRLLSRLGSVPLVVRPSFQPVGRPVSLPPGSGQAPGFLVSDRASGRLLEVSLAAGGPTVRDVGAAVDVYAAATGPDGRLAIATWDAQRKRIVLLEAQGDGAFRETVVTPSDGVSALALVSSAGGWVFLYDEVAPAPLGRWTHAITLLAPSPGPGGRPRYHKLILSSGLDPVRLFRTLEVDGWLYVLELRDKARLLRARVP